MLIIGFAVGALVFLWVGCWLGLRVGRWRSERERRTSKRGVPLGHDVVERVVQRADKPPLMKLAKTVPFDFSNLPVKDFARSLTTLTGVVPIAKTVPRPAQDARVVLAKPRVVPIGGRPAPREVSSDALENPRDTGMVVELATQDDVYLDVVSVLVASGFKRSEAMTAAKACTPAERAGGLEAWTAAAIRGAASAIRGVESDKP